MTKRGLRDIALCVSVVAVVMWLTTVTGRAPRLAQEATAIGSIRAVLSAERTFADASGGQFGGWSCLSAAGCLPTIRFANGLLSTDFGERLARAGYRIELSGAPAEENVRLGDTSALYFHYAVAAIPIGTSSGPSICADDTGQVFVDTTELGLITEGRCADRSTPLP